MPYLGELSALLTAFLWTGSSLVFASATNRVGSFKVNITRLILALVYLIILIFVAGLNYDLTLRQSVFLFMSGVVGLAMGDTFLFKAYELIGARITMLIMSLAPAIAAALSYLLLDEILSFLGITGIVITISGICLVVMERNDNGRGVSKKNSAGILYAFFAAAGQGIGLVLAKIAFLDGAINSFVATAVRIAASLIILIPFAIVTNRYQSPVKTFLADKTAMMFTVIGSFLGPFFGITFSLIAVANTKVGIASTIMAIVPILMLPVVKIIHKERLSIRAIAGAFIAVGGVAILFLR
ncbi:MAG: DMT family transporter [Ignavibacteriales bacterium]|nr:DMT family transporter [Ignavibacteriales bacterium]